ncbi:E3 ubiquitin-protein ligase SH3RF2 isoform X2 [Salminus brasiliensis]|uniref:E3 ubiquitin-protein ligase SH3RF2 isoform X2 n=1 Tax=Salminus brasiliensis TaxID=930266 RepID=UPI003B83987B
MHFASASSEGSQEEDVEHVAVLDLLECPLCMEPLDVTAKVLPCQHTFCKPCLLRLESSSLSRLPICCPQCHAPLSGRVEDLPTNLLLARLIQGLQRERLTTPRDRSGVYVSSTAQGGSEVEVLHTAQQQTGRGTQGVLAKASYNYQGNGPGELAMKSGDIASLRWRGVENLCYTDAKGSSGLIPTKMVQVLSDPVQPVALCRALFDFDLNRLDPEDRKECLPFLKGDLISVIKRVDENWCEGRLRDRVGIFPLQFTEPNPAALKLLGRGKGGDSAESRPQDTRQSRGHRRFSGTTRPPQVSLLNSLNTRPPYSHVQSQQPQHSGPAAPPAPGKAAQLGPASKQRSGSARRSLTKGERKMNGEVPPTITMALINPQAPPPPPESKQSSTQQLSISVCAALYSYSPHRPEELELRKGEMVGVYGKFKEGWLRGLSLRTGKVGILPANYVTPVLRTSARFLEQPKPAAPIASATVATKRYTHQKPQTVVLALDKVKTDGTSAAPVIAMPPQPALSSVSAARAPQAVGKPGWDTVRRAFQPSHRGSPHRGSYHAQNSAPSFHPPPQDLGQIYGFGRSPVLPRKRNGLFTNPIRPQHWTNEGMTPSSGGYHTMDGKYSLPKEMSTAPQSILVKPDSHRYNTEKPVKSVRFSTEELSQTTTRLSSLSTGAQIIGNSQSCSTALEHWNPSAILGRDGSTSVLKDTKTLQQRKGPTQNHTTIDGLQLTMKPPIINAQSSPSRHRVVMGYNAQTDTELNLLEGELVLVQRPRPDGRVLVTQEITGRTGLFHNSIVDILDKVV